MSMVIASLSVRERLFHREDRVSSMIGGVNRISVAAGK